ncbi:MAG: rhomboid family intramembrane serine protease [Acidobacteria bacterium]|nr:rhomboid family intramembrane serine protease [Acidobacteriota bacterium]
MNYPYNVQYRFGPKLTAAAKVLIGINIAVYLVLTVDRTSLNTDFGRVDLWLSLIPFRVWGSGEAWRLLTYMFLHGPPLHLVFNLLMLWMFGSECEGVLGRRRFVAYYLVTGVGAGLCQMGLAAIMPSIAGVPVMGASGAVYGLLLAYAIFFPNRWLLLFFAIPVKAKYLVAGCAILELLMTVSNFRDGIAHVAHLGGIVFGYFMLKRRTFRADLRYHWLRLKAWHYRRKFKVVRKSDRPSPPRYYH